MRKKSIDNVLHLSDIFLAKTANLNDQRLKDIDAIPSFAGRIAYCNKTFKRMKAGSSRIAYEYSPEYVLKLAKNQKGLAQNKTESDSHIQSHYTRIVTIVASSSPNDFWVVVEKATKLTEAEFASLTGVTFKTFSDYVRKRIDFRMFGNTKVENEEMLHDHEFVQEVLGLMSDFAMPAYDVVNIKHWGKARGRPVLLDYGLTDSIYEEHYS